MNRLNGKIVLITGIGLASAQRLIDEGAKTSSTARRWHWDPTPGVYRQM